MSYTEHVTRVLTEEIRHARLGTVAVIRFAPESEGSRRPATMGPKGVQAIVSAVNDAIDRAEGDRIQAIALTGTDRVFLAGADLSLFEDPQGAQGAVNEMTRAMHDLHLRIRTAPVPVLAHINGTALGGGLETALLADYRTAEPGVRSIGLPEISLGILPGWGGTSLLPGLVGPEAAVRLILQDPARNKQLSAREAEAVGLVHRQADSFEHALDAFAEYADGIRDTLRHEGRANPIPDNGSDAATVMHAVLDGPFSKTESIRQWATRQYASGNPAPLRALQHLELLPGKSLEQALTIEQTALLDLVLSDAAAGSLYAAELLRHGKPGREKVEDSRDIARAGVAGAGLMAAQIAAQLALGLQVPVIMRDLEDEIVEKGVKTARGILEDAAKAGRISSADAKAAGKLITGTTRVLDLRECDLVIEAVTEVMRVKQSVLAELEDVLPEEAVLASNTSSLSIAEMSEHLTHPERVVGLHFFNPVAKMPLVEVVHTEDSSDEAIATAREVVRRLGKFAVRSLDRPGFIVNRLLFRVMPEVLRAVDHGADPEAANASLDEIGMPMRPFTLLDLVGHGVAQHVGQTMVRELSSERYYDSPGLAEMIHRGEQYTVPDRSREHPEVSPAVAEVAATLPTSRSAQEAGSRAVEEPATGDSPALTGDALLRKVQDGLAEEIALMLDEDVVEKPEQIDLALILGAGFPRHRGGITPYLDQVGASERVNGKTFHGKRFTRES